MEFRFEILQGDYVISITYTRFIIQIKQIRSQCWDRDTIQNFL